MKRLILLALVLLAIVAPETQATNVERGYASAYADGAMESVIEYRMANDIWRNDPPVDWRKSHGAIAAMDCSRVGELAELIDPDGREYRVLIADCAGPGDPERFTRANIILELDWELWTRLVDEHGRPLEVGLR